MAAFERPSAGADLLAASADLPTVSVAPGEILVQQGESAAAIYVLQSGGMVIERDGEPFARVEHAGAVFGEMSAVMGTVATATVRAAEPSVLRKADDPAAFLARPNVALAVLRMTAARLDAMTRYLADVRNQFGELDTHLGMVNGILETLLHHQAPAVRPGSARDPEG
jgi:CRP/FNR family transcriptional regulator, cyclic AMP receptor protein